MSAGDLTKESPEAVPDISFPHELLDASEHILFRMDLVRRGYDYISPVAAAIFGVSLEALHERGLDLLLAEQVIPEE